MKKQNDILIYSHCHPANGRDLYKYPIILQKTFVIPGLTIVIPASEPESIEIDPSFAGMTEFPNPHFPQIPLSFLTYF